MALESSGAILYVAKILYQSDSWFGNCQGGPKLYRETHTHTQIDRHTHRQTDRQTHTHTHTHARSFSKPFRHFTHVIAHSPTLPSLYLRHSSFSNPSIASPTSQFILQPFFCFTYITSSSLNSPGEPPMVKVLC